LNTIEEYMFPCLNKSILGVECTGCGGQRAALLLVQGEFKEAFYMYPAIYGIAGLLIFLFINLLFKFKYDFHVKIVLIIFTALMMAGNYIFKIIHFLN